MSIWYLPNDSTVNQLIEIYRNIISNMDRGRDVRFVFCDVSKAFDKVWHKGLIFKLKLTGVNEQLISWIESYLISSIKSCLGRLFINS